MKTLKVVMKVLLILAIVVIVIIVAVLLFLEFSPTVGKMPGKKDKARFASLTSQFHDGKFNNENATSTMTGDSYPSSNRKKLRLDNAVENIGGNDLTHKRLVDLFLYWHHSVSKL